MTGEREEVLSWKLNNIQSRAINKIKHQLNKMKAGNLLLDLKSVSLMSTFKSKVDMEAQLRKELGG